MKKERERKTFLKVFLSQILAIDSCRERSDKKRRPPFQQSSKIRSIFIINSYIFRGHAPRKIYLGVPRVWTSRRRAQTLRERTALTKPRRADSDQNVKHFVSRAKRQKRAREKDFFKSFSLAIDFI